MTTTKLISWAYPSSFDARRFAFGKTGCYCVYLRQHKLAVAKAVAGFATFNGALEHAERYPYEFDKLTMKNSGE